MLLRQGFSFKLNPDGAQRRLFNRFAGCARWVYNQGLAWNEEQREIDPSFKLSYKELCSALIGWKNQNPWLKETHSQVLQQSVKDLDRGFANFFRGNAGFPKKHKKFGSTDSFRYPQGFKIKEATKQIYLPCIGWVKYRRSRYINGKPKNVTVSRKADGWYLSIQTEYDYEIPRHPGNVVGMDMGVKRYFTLSDETHIEPMNALKRNLKKLAKAQAKLARMTKFGKNWHKQLEKIAKLHQHIANIRRDFIEKASLEVCKKHAVIFREDLKIRNMTASAKGTVEEPGKNVAQKSGLNRSILDQAWGTFFVKLEWKALKYGCSIIKVPPQNTSRECPKCHHTSKNNRKTQANFTCVACGCHENADVVAAVNIKERGQRLEACGMASVDNAPVLVNLSQFVTELASNQQQEPIEETVRRAAKSA